jgi:tripartite-type tricarboxylate transporter receptor subunit TctC
MSNWFKARRTLLVAGAMLVASQALPISAAAQSNYPNRPIRFLVGFAPGGSADNVARVVAAEMSKNLGQQIVIENKTGASANIATQTLLAAPADGYTILFAGLSLATNPALIESLGYNPNKDLVMVSQITALPVVSLTRGDSPLNNLQDVITTAKAKNGTLRFGSGGIGTTSHLAPELMSRSAGFKYTHVPYRGGAPALQALFSGETDLMFDLMTPTLKSNADAGKIKFLGVMQKDATPLLPGVKPAGAQGVPEAALMRSWQGVAVKNGTPPDIVAKLHQSVTTALKSREVVEKLNAIGTEVKGSTTPAEFQKLYDDELARWTALIKAAGIKAEQ